MAARAAQRPSTKRHKSTVAQGKGATGPYSLAAGKKTPLGAAKVSSVDSRVNNTARPVAWEQEDNQPNLCFPARPAKSAGKHNFGRSWNMSLGAQQADEQTAFKPLRIRLTGDQARKIFLYTLRPGQNPSSDISVALAETYGVSVKTRDLCRSYTHALDARRASVAYHRRDH